MDGFCRCSTLWGNHRAEGTALSNTGGFSCHTWPFTPMLYLQQLQLWRALRLSILVLIKELVGGAETLLHVFNVEAKREDGEQLSGLDWSRPLKVSLWTKADKNVTQTLRCSFVRLWRTLYRETRDIESIHLNRTKLTCQRSVTTGYWHKQTHKRVYISGQRSLWLLLRAAEQRDVRVCVCEMGYPQKWTLLVEPSWSILIVSIQEHLDGVVLDVGIANNFLVDRLVVRKFILHL